MVLGVLVMRFICSVWKCGMKDVVLFSVEF